MNAVARVLGVVSAALRRGSRDPRDSRGRGQRGFTLIEVVAGVAIMATIGGVFVTSLWELTTAGEIGNANQSVTVEVRRAALWLERDIYRSTSTDVPDLGGSVSTAQLDWTDDTGPHTCIYALSGTDLVRTCDGVPATVAKNLSDLGFTRSGSLLTVAFTATAPTRSTINKTVDINLVMKGG